MTRVHDTISFHLAQVCRNHRNLAATQLAPHGLHAGQDLILAQLWQEDGVTQSCLAERVGVDVSTMTKALQRLERYGFVRRCQDSEDTRAVRVHLTDEGRALESVVAAMFLQVEARTLAGFTEVERAFLAQLLYRMKDNLS